MYHQENNGYQPARFTLSSKQSAFVDSPALYATCEGGAASGKTHAGALRAMKFSRMYPSSHGIVIAQRPVVLSALRKVAPSDALWDMRTSTLCIPNASEIHIHAPTDMERLRGRLTDWVWIDNAEYCEEETFRQLVVLRPLRGIKNAPRMWITGYRIPEYVRRLLPLSQLMEYTLDG